MASSGSETGRPLVIGLTTYLEQAKTGVWDVPAAFLPKVYFDAVVKAGAIPVLLPPQPLGEHTAAAVVDRLDGLIVTGGKDVDPARYGQAPHPETDAPRRDRDDWEDALLAAAIERGTPFLGICRGLQVLNVHRGGTLHQHLPDLVGSMRYNAGGGVFTTNSVTIDQDTVIGDTLAATPVLGVQSYHHQAVDQVGDGLLVTARSDDGTIQAIELDGARYGVAVQWHPEEAPEDIRLFSGLVDAAREWAEAGWPVPEAVSA
ncbi:gamma-glutamyl-gamma-aminobutyrate hydrolase family protein [Homoserinibacter sp. YIM 151385]|uniref:gamma-glutamyl-gamma-aminobutyrate hydrolase family protein n=1 Tax=Homoserinibacter sp. YIM 151385 TaxID=2985506 RepID=UPI0022F144A6|nr:gamma-glutamyl-gamma-aminobutyrate hydrolase family protein [Homoserinibacter sp. YIM 151385]WBU37836.1 gamma-glutamyl-gamma-aminobutyrate hydrolase family protein [Homoserinibacter sp. YIM 151385]